VNEFFAFLTTHKEAFATLAAVIGGAFALWRWIVDQRWRRVQYAYDLVEKFFAKENTKKALAMLDTETKIELFPNELNSEDRRYFVDDALIIEALRTDMHTGFDRPTFAVRLIFDEFFTDFSMFQHHIDAKLIKLTDVRPYPEYWINSINGHSLVFEQVHTIELATRINEFLKSFGYKAILELSKSMGISLRKQAEGSSGTL
jgi:hypothetical protein